MASTTALFTGLSGLNAHARSLEVIGNNIANVNTTSFKSSSAVFQNMFSRTIGSGTTSSASTGGTNPYQVGLGVRIGAIQRNMSGGTTSATGDPRQLAIDGEGFFVLRNNGSTTYTRDGSFELDGDNYLVSAGGARVQGYGVDDRFNVIAGTLSDLSIPLGRLSIAEATENAVIGGNLDASGDVAAQGSVIELSSSTTAGNQILGPGGVPASTASLLIQLEDVNGDAIFAAGQELVLDGATKGGGAVPTSTLAITAGTTLADLMTWLEGAMGIQNTGVNPDGNTPGITFDPVAGTFTVVGNTGTANALSITSTNLALRNADGSTAGYPLAQDVQTVADGESKHTIVTVYDSLGTALDVDVTLTLVSRTTTGTIWRYDVESAANMGGSLAMATGTINFDNEGQLLDTTPISVSLNRSGTGAASPQVINLSFASDKGRTTALADKDADIGAIDRDGLAFGTLQDFSVGANGVISGAFSNGAVRALGQVALATFTNPAGLVDAGTNQWVPGANSGEMIVGEPQSMGSGSIVGGALELSNVDLAAEFIDLITTQTGYSAATRVIQTTDELMQQLLVLGR